MNKDFLSHDAAIVRGHAWHVYPDPATPGVLAGDNPFGADEPPSPERVVQPPPPPPPPRPPPPPPAPPPPPPPRRPPPRPRGGFFPPPPRGVVCFWLLN